MTARRGFRLPLAIVVDHCRFVVNRLGKLQRQFTRGVSAQFQQCDLIEGTAFKGRQVLAGRVGKRKRTARLMEPSSNSVSSLTETSVS